MTSVQNDTEVERHLVGTLMSEPDSWDVVADIVFPECFTDPVYRVIADCVWDQAKIRKPFDPVSLASAAKDSGNDVDVALLLTIAGDSTTVESVIRHWAERLRKLWAIRERRKVAISMLNDEPNDSVEEQLAKDSSRLLAIETGSTRRERHQKEILLERLEQLEAESKDGPLGRMKKLVDTGIKGLDGLLMGMRPGEPVLIAARPSVGKSALAVAIMEHCASNGYPTAAWWLEDFADSWATRVLARRCQIPASLLRHGSSLRKEHWDSLLLNLNASADWPLYLDDTHGLTARQLAQRMRRVHRVHAKPDKPFVFVADHLGEVKLEKGEAWGDRHDLALGSAIRIFRDTAKDLGGVPILFAQLGRESEKRGGDARMSDIFGTGEAEQIVRIAIFLRRDGDRLFANVVKNTNGPRSEIELEWDPATMSVRSSGVVDKRAPIAVSKMASSTAGRWGGDDEDSDD